jgi:arginase family enzyme
VVAGKDPANSDAARIVLDNAWDFQLPAEIGSLPRIDAAEIGRSLRFITSRGAIEEFNKQFGSRFRSFMLSGSGDFHHLSAVFARRIQKPFVILSFDNHPDWDIRPPYWSCGAWVNRALESRFLEQIAVWGCGSFECRFPGRLLGNRTACRANRLWIAPWKAEGTVYPEWLHPITIENWRAAFNKYLESIRTRSVYITIDLDCLRESEAVTNWENGQFAVEDILWALDSVRSKAIIVGGDLCGAFSTLSYGSWFQTLAGRFDHPRQRIVQDSDRRFINHRALQAIWPRLIGNDFVQVPE